MFDSPDRCNITYEGAGKFRVIHVGSGKEIEIEAEDVQDAYYQALEFWRIPKDAASREIEVEAPGSNAPVVFINDKPPVMPSARVAISCTISFILLALALIYILAAQQGFFKWPW